MTTIHVVDAFTKKTSTGNRAGVVLEAESLTTSEMQEIAAFAGYSETAFVLPPTGKDHDLHVRYFTPNAEVPICGHATIATHFLRAQRWGADHYPIRVKTGAGIIPISVRTEGTDLLVSMTQGDVEFGTILDKAERLQLAAALNISVSDFVADLPIQIVSTGHSKVIVPLKCRELLNSLKPNSNDLIALSKSIDCNGFFLFVLSGTSEIPETYGRMFAPAIGIEEDPVTGNANGPTGAYLVQYKLVNFCKSITYLGHQGHSLRKAGTVHVTVSTSERGLVTTVAGYAVLVGCRVFQNSQQP
ncbi:MAG: PhzF family phenazine biosynthesis isomerase [Roseibium sp.]|uniref:PhzF family phenazine biosynthesis isomerase n=1 Tax=Roseibium sp. TaxID=1936156 RepID=UPI00262B0066|nr:PhzF family phenazine biosynthesis isomerase [Roseibium sp.]MCV0428254.1 PhzF family phenazine biosynthesis isomerase [Roseibium sp.]